MTSARVVSAKASTSRPTLIKAPPGVKPSVGYQYEVLLLVEEQGDKAPELLGEPEDVSGKAVGSWDSAIIQAGSKVLQVAKVGRKRAATSEAPGASEHTLTQIPPPLASAEDFSPSHFDKPQSGGLLDVWQDGVGTNTEAVEQWVTGVGRKLPLPMAVEPRALTWAQKGKGKVAATPGSSPVVENPFRRQSTQDIYHTRNADAAWSIAQGLVPAGDKHQPAGYTPVGGVMYKVVSPKNRGLSTGRRLFLQYWENMDGDVHTQQGPSQTGLRSAQQLAEQAPFTRGAVHARIEPGLQGPQMDRATCTCEDPGQRTGLVEHC
jgi:hypothetical protein